MRSENVLGGSSETCFNIVTNMMYKVCNIYVSCRKVVLRMEYSWIEMNVLTSFSSFTSKFRWLVRILKGQ